MSKKHATHPHESREIHHIHQPGMVFTPDAPKSETKNDDKSEQQAESKQPVVEPHLPDPREGLKPEQKAALLLVKTRTADVDRLLRHRVKLLLPATIVILLVSFYNLIRSIWDLTNPYAVLFSLVIIGLTTYLLYARDHHTAGIVIKIIMLTQFIMGFGFLYSPTIFMINCVGLIILLFVYLRIKTLSYS